MWSAYWKSLPSVPSLVGYLFPEVFRGPSFLFSVSLVVGCDGGLASDMQTLAHVKEEELSVDTM